MATLSVVCSNLSTSLRQLERWDLIKPVYIRGDRQCLEAIQGGWEKYQVILEDGKKRELVSESSAAELPDDA